MRSHQMHQDTSRVGGRDTDAKHYIHVYRFRHSCIPFCGNKSEIVSSYIPTQTIEEN